MSLSPEQFSSPLGLFTRAVTRLGDGEALAHDWFESGEEPTLMIRGASAEQVEALIPTLEAALTAGPARVRAATDAIVREFSEDEPSQAELDEAAVDLVLGTVEATEEGDVIFHFDDSCGEHFMEGYWPAVRFDSAGTVLGVSVEA